MEVVDTTSAILRQGTFDTDPQETLRSKSGGIKRGAIALPVIADETESQAEQTRTKVLLTSLDQTVKGKSTVLKNGQKTYRTKTDKTVEKTNEKDNKIDIKQSKKVTESSIKQVAKDERKKGISDNYKVLIHNPSVPSETDRSSSDVIRSSKHDGATKDSNSNSEETHLSSDVEQTQTVENDKETPLCQIRRIDNGPDSSKAVSRRFSKSNDRKLDKVSTLDSTSKQQISVRTNAKPKQTVNSENSNNEKKNKGNQNNKTNSGLKETKNTTRSPTSANNDVNTTSASSDTSAVARTSSETSGDGEVSSNEKSIKQTPLINTKATDKANKLNHIDTDSRELEDSKGKQMSRVYNLSEGISQSNRAPNSTSFPYKENYDPKQPMDKMDESYEAVYMERETLLTAENAYKRRIKQLEDELAQFLKNIDQLREENKLLRTKIDELESTKKVSGEQSSNTVIINTEVDELKLQNSSLALQLDDTNAKVKHLTARNTELGDENRELKERLDNLVGTNNNDNYPTPSPEVVDDDRNDQLEDELSGVKEQLEKVKTKELALEYEVKTLKATEEKKKREANDLQSENKQLQYELEKYKEAARVSSEQSDEDGEVTARDKAELKSQIVKLQTENQTINEENIKLKSECIEHVKSIHELEKAIKVHKQSVTDAETAKLQEIERMKRENEKLEKELKEFKTNHGDKDAKIKKLEAENKTVSQQLAQKRAEVDELMSAFKGDKLEDEIDQLKETNKKLNEKLEDTEKKHSDEISQQVEQYKQDNVQLKQQLQGKEAELETSLQTTKDMKQTIDKEQKEKQSLKQELDNVQKERERLQNSVENVERVQEQIKESRDVLVARDDEISELRKKCHDLEQLNKTQKAEFQEDFDILKQENIQERQTWKKDLEREKLQGRDAVDRQKKITAELENKKDHEINLLNKELHMLKAEVESSKSSKVLEREVKELSHELRTVYQKYSELTVELDQKNTLEQRLFEMTMRMEKMNTRMKLMEKDQREWASQKESVGDIEASNRRLTEENIQLRKMLDSGRYPQGQVSNRIEFLEMKQHDADTRVKQLEGWVGGLYDENTDPSHRHRRKQRSSDKRQSKGAYSKQRSSQIMENNYLSSKEPEYRHRPHSADNVPDNSSTPSLPSIQSTSGRVASTGRGYSQIHRNRIENAAKRRF